MVAFLLTPLGPLLLAALANAFPAVNHPIPKATSPHYFFTFGDSYSQTGFNITLAHPSASNPLGNPPFPGWTTSGGANWLGFLSTTYNASQILTYNFAYGGATVDASLVAPYAPTVLSVIDQVAIFSQYVAAKPDWAAWTSKDSTFGVWIGVNDVGNSWWMEGETERIQKIIAKYFEQVEVLYKAGARRFVFLGVPPITRSPLVLNGNDAASRALEDSVIATFNSTLTAAAKQLKSTHEDVSVYVVETTPSFNEALDHPTKYGAPNATCYNADGKSCLWFNDYHPGIAIQDLVAQKVAKTVGAPFKTK